jgi:hypothetical protein
MRKTILSLLLGFAVLAGFATHVGAQSSTELITYNELNTLVANGTLSATGASGCSVSGTEIVSQSYFTTCIHNSGSCFSGQGSTYVPTYAAMIACKTAGGSSTPAPTATPTATPTPAGHTSGLSVTDGCITSTSHWPAISGDPNTPVFQANSVITGSTCGSSGNQLDSGDARQVLNGGSSVNAGTVVVVGADLYGQTQTVNVGSSDCTLASATANGTAKVLLVDSGGTIKSQTYVVGNGAWSYKTVSFTIATTGVYYIEIVSVNARATASGAYAKLSPHGDGTICTPISETASAKAFVTGMTVSSS